VSSRSTIWLSPEVRNGLGIHVYREVLDDWIYVDISRGYGFHFRICPTRSLARRWLRR